MGNFKLPKMGKIQLPFTTTITNNIIIGKLVRVSPYELEVEVKGRDGKPENLIVMKHFIAYLKFTQ